jgi:2-polyprenyl-3-methyl-5-hydroxy-6-metoxy-1,4-benzoquinol methylase
MISRFFMHPRITLIRAKNWLKVRLPRHSWSYMALRSIYGMTNLEQRWFRKRSTESGKFEAIDDLHMCSLLPKYTIDRVISLFAPRSWLDVGCGTGAALAYVADKGIVTVGVERSSVAIRHSRVRERIIQHDLSVPLTLNRKFDVVWCYEVAEHLPAGAADRLVETLCRHGDIVVFSAAPPGQGGNGHVNEQPAAYWIGRFETMGFGVDESATAQLHAVNELFSSNIIAFVRRPNP